MAGDIIIHHVISERLRSVVILVVYNIIYTQISSIRVLHEYVRNLL